MKYRPYKFNIIAFVMVALMVITIGFTSMPTTNVDPGNDPGTEEPGGDNPPPFIEPDDGDDVDPDTIPKYAIPLINYGLNFLETCKGYKSKAEQVTTSVVMGVNVEQLIKSYIYRNGDTMLWENYCKCSMQQGAFFYRYFYGNKQNIETLKVDKCDYDNEYADFSKANVKNQTLEEFNAENMDIFTFPFEITSANSKVISDRIEGKYRKIKISFNKNAVSDNYKLQYYASGIVVPDSLNITNDLEFVFYISRSTGKIIKYEKYEKYEVVPTTFTAVTALMDSKYVEEFQILDQAVEFEKPIEKVLPQRT